MPKRKGRFKSTFGDLAQNAKSAGKAAAQSAKATGAAAFQRVKSIGKTTVQSVNAAGDVASQKSEVVKDTVSRGAGSIRDATMQGVRIARDVTDAVRQRVPRDSIRNSLTDAIKSSKALSVSAKQRLIAQLSSALDSLSKDGLIDQTQAFIIIQGILASDQISREVSGWIQSFIEGLAPINVDATVVGYTETVGSGVYLSESSNYAEAIDAMYIDTVASESYTLANLEISRSWLNNLASYDVLELIAGSIGILAVALNWNNDDIEEFSSLVGSIGLSAAVSGNPLMLITTVAAMARAFHVARKSGDWKEFSDGLAKGGICTGAVLLTTSLMSGPMVVVLLSGICVGILAHQATKNVSFVEIGQFVIQRIGKDAKPEIA